MSAEASHSSLADFVAHYLAEQQFPPMGHDGHEIRPRVAVIPPSQPYGTPMAFLRVVSHHFPIISLTSPSISSSSSASIYRTIDLSLPMLRIFPALPPPANPPPSLRTPPPAPPASGELHLAPFPLRFHAAIPCLDLGSLSGFPQLFYFTLSSLSIP